MLELLKMFPICWVLANVTNMLDFELAQLILVSFPLPFRFILYNHEVFGFFMHLYLVYRYSFQ